MRIYIISFALLLFMVSGALAKTDECTMITGNWEMIMLTGDWDMITISGEWEMIKECELISGEWDMILKCGDVSCSFKFRNPNKVVNACRSIIDKRDTCRLISGEWEMIKETEHTSELVSVNLDSFLYIITSSEISCITTKQLVIIGANAIYHVTSLEPLKGYWESHDGLNCGSWYVFE